MPFLPVVFIMPFIVLIWTARYWRHRMLTGQRDQQEVKLWEEIARHKREAQIARPLQEYVAGLKSKPIKKILLRFPLGSHSPPTLGNIGRFTALAINDHSEQYFVQDEEGKVYGPADEGTLQQWIREERITANTPVSSHESGPWLPACQVRALRGSFADMIRSAVATGRFDNIELE